MIWLILGYFRYSHNKKSSSDEFHLNDNSEAQAAYVAFAVINFPSGNCLMGDISQHPTGYHHHVYVYLPHPKSNWHFSAQLLQPTFSTRIGLCLDDSWLI
jgi:hypothetical protein